MRETPFLAVYRRPNSFTLAAPPNRLHGAGRRGGGGNNVSGREGRSTIDITRARRVRFGEKRRAKSRKTGLVANALYGGRSFSARFLCATTPKPTGLRPIRLHPGPVPERRVPRKKRGGGSVSIAIPGPALSRADFPIQIEILC